MVLTTGHGDEKVHRSGGSLVITPSRTRVQRQEDGRSLGRRACVTQQGLTIVEVRPEDNVILIKGAVPGPKNGLVLVRKQ